MRDKLEHAITHAENTKKKAFEKSVSQWKAKEDAMEALCKGGSDRRYLEWPNGPKPAGASVFLRY